MTIPDGVETIGRGAFKGNTSITSVSLPDSVTFIDEDAFSGCTSLCNAVLPNGIIEIGRSAFEGSGLTGTVTVSDGMTIGSSAFAGTNITDVVINVPSGGSVDIGSNAFADCGSLGSLWLISEGDNLISFSEDGIFTGCGDINVFHPDSFILNIMYPSQLTADMLGLNGSIAFGTINDQNMPPA